MDKQKNKKLLVVLDANTLMRGVIHPRFAFEIMNHAFKGDFNLVLLPYTIEEAVRNISKKFPDRLPSLEEFLLNCPYNLLENPTIKEIEKNKGLVRHDPDLPLAVASIKAKVNYLVSNDDDFIGTDVSTKAIQAKVNCISAGNFLKKIMGWSSVELSDIQNRKWGESR